MLVTDEGNIIGSISGGCLEGDALRKAMQVMLQGKSRLVTYDTSDEDDLSIGVQMGCEGIIKVLFEPVDQHQPDNPVNLIKKVLGSRSNAVLITFFSLDARNNHAFGTCMLLESDHSIHGSIPIPELRADVIKDAHRALEEKHSLFVTYQLQDRHITAFIEFLCPRLSLVIVGAGNDAIPIMQMASVLGWDVRVVDGRNSHARTDRFSAACQVLVSKPEAALEQIPIDERTAFIMMTHNYHYDYSMLKALIGTPVPYIGMLGPKKKLKRMLGDLESSGFVIDDQMLNRIYGPSGLDLGAETAEEIALSIISEIQAVVGQKVGGMLRDKSDVIHERDRFIHDVRIVRPSPSI
jgi:xanthine/CO dehydrogenase XdhC/CoxF family maturation factor